MRSKLLLLTGVAIAGGIALYAATQIWVTVSLVVGAAASDTLGVTGQQVNQSLSPVAIAALAAALALTIAGKIFRRILGVLIMLLGAGIAAIAFAVLRSPETAVAGRLAEATGIEGAAQAGMIAGVSTSFVVMLTVLAGVLLIVLGVLVLVFAGRWKAAGRKYESDAPAKARVSDEPDRISDWEAQNEGYDPSEDR